MVEKLVSSIINELKKHNIDRIYHLSSYIFNQCLPFPKLLREFYLLHVWIKYNNKRYDVGFEQFVRNNGVKDLPYQLSIEEPIDLENIDNNYK